MSCDLSPLQCKPALVCGLRYVSDARGVLQPDYLLIDGLKGGSGEAFDWKALQIPAGEASRGWLLAGGLMPANVAEAVAVARSGGVDVSSGVCGPDGAHRGHHASSSRKRD